MKTAIVLLSGGLDSATTLAVARDEDFDVVALSFRYGQRHALEIDAARAIARHFGVREHRVVDIDLRAFGGSALTDDIPVPKDRPLETGPEIPITYVPARNTIFLAFALAVAEVSSARDIFIGVNAVDYSGYPDCRPQYIAAFEQLAALATRAAVEGRPTRIRAPLIALPKHEIVALGLRLGVPFGLTRSCYDPDPAGRACGRCDSCRIRLAAFQTLGRPDPASYADR
ncbi:MAG: 7-cyano-7-deazaguanine synthase [Phycisphaerae bacterium]|nr:7-cyano-7-deazaguanine synthase [Phycisphaerae bacterium]